MRRLDKMAKNETLTAYKCKFSYLQRNNPLIKDQRKLLKKGKSRNILFQILLKIIRDTREIWQ